MDPISSQGGGEEGQSRQPQPGPNPGGIRIGDVGGSVNFSALGDIVGGDKITTITTTIQISVEAVTQRPLITTSPYRGLDRFEDRDKDLFFGRDQLIKSLLTQLSASNVLLVLGASGSGKSSVVRAGLLPQLAQLIGAKFRYFTFVPDVNPFESLRAALQGGGFSQTQTRELAEAKAETAANLAHTLQRSGDQWLFFVDQFEEIFTVGDEKLRGSFIAALVAIAQDPNSSTKLVLAMRADFLDRFSPFPQFAKIIEKNIDFVADMHVDELRQAIEQPAARHGVVFEQGLVEEIIKDVQGQAGSLPLLQYTLDLLWQEEAREDGLADRHLNTRAYRELGGVRGALQKRADEIYASFGDGSDAKAATPKQEIVRQIFLRLVDLAGEGSNDAAWRPVRRRASMAMFTAAQEQEILQALINQKLLVSNREGDDATVEVAHEALFTSWGRLKNWIEAGKQVIFARNRLADDARRWQRRQQEDADAAEEELLSGSRLAQALDMRTRGDFSTVVGGLGETETQFLDASAALRDRRAREEQARQQRELEAAQRLAAARKVAAGRLRIGLAVAVVLAVAALLLAVQAHFARQGAAKQAAKARDTSVQADFDVALMDRENADEVSPRTLAHLARALRTMPEHRLPRQLLISLLRDRPWCIPRPASLRHGKQITTATLSTDGLRVVSVGEDYAARLWDAATGKLLGELPRGEEGTSAVTPSPDGRRVVIASFNKTARVWDLASGKQISELVQDGRKVVGVCFNADGQRIVTACKDGSGRVWDAATGKPICEPLQHEELLTGAAISPDGRRVALLYDNGGKIWDVGSSKTVGVDFRHRERVLAVTFSQDGRYLATASRDKTARIWNVESGLPVGEPAPHDDEVVAVSFSPDGRRIVTASYDRTARVWDAATGKPVSDPMRHDSKVLAASFSPDGRSVVTASEDKTAVVWDAESGRSIREPLRHETDVVAANFSADGGSIFSASRDGIVRLWSAESGRPINRILRQEGTVEAASFSADGRRIVTAGYGGGTARLWDAESGIPVGAPLRHYINRPVPAFSADGRRVVTVSDENSARVWDAETGKPVGEPLNHGNHIIAVTFSAGDRHLVTADWGGAVKVWDLATGKLAVESLPQVAGRYVEGFSADGSLVVMGSKEGFFSVWATETGKAVGKAMPRPGTSSIKGMDFSTDHRRMALAFDDWTARIWDLESGELVLHEYDVDSVSFGAGDTRVVTASRDRTARVWNVNTGQPVSEPMRHGDEVFSAKFSGDGTRVVTASLDTTARVWDAQTGKSLGEPFRHKDRVVAASFSADGRRVVTASWDKTAAIWDVAMDAASPLPPWVPELAEALAGQHLDENGLMAPPAKNLAQVREELLGIKGADFWSRFGRWFFMRGPERTISPDSRITIGELEHLQAEAGKERAEKSPAPPIQP